MVGLTVGLLCGGGGVYLALERPWDGGDEVAALDAGVTVAKSKKKKAGKKRRKRRPRSSPTGEVVLTAADRKLEWRGKKLALPEREVDFSAGEGGRSLSAGEINQVVKRSSQPVVDCIEKARGQAEMRTAVTLKLLVDGSGSVVKSRIRAPSYLFDQGFAKCARGASTKLRFPATGGSTIVTAPYDLY
jgi:hypothetical protein